jgi:proteasome activator subunit 4
MDDMSAPHRGRVAALLDTTDDHQLLAPKFHVAETISRSTTPGIPNGRSCDEDDKRRYRPRTFQYFNHLPFEVEEQAQRDAALEGILKELFIAVKAEDFAPGALHWTRELQAWLNLKFEMTRELRATLARLYYHMSLAPGLDITTSDRFARMLVSLTRYLSLHSCSLQTVN